MLLSVVYVGVQRVLQLLFLRFRSSPSKDLEIVVLPHQLAVLRRQVRRPAFWGRRPVFLSAASRLCEHRRRMGSRNGSCGLFGPKV